MEFFLQPSSYGPMKAAMRAYANELGQGLGAKGIRVNSVSPGSIYFEGGAWEMIKKSMPPMYESTVKQCPNGRLGSLEEVANAAAFLLSPAASLISGVNLVVDGGFTKRVNF